MNTNNGYLIQFDRGQMPPQPMSGDMAGILMIGIALVAVLFLVVSWRNRDNLPEIPFGIVACISIPVMIVSLLISAFLFNIQVTDSDHEEHRVRVAEFHARSDLNESIVSTTTHEAGILCKVDSVQNKFGADIVKWESCDITLVDLETGHISRYNDFKPNRLPPFPDRVTCAVVEFYDNGYDTKRVMYVVEQSVCDNIGVDSPTNAQE